MAEREGFEPPVSCPTTVFKTAALNHSAISPKENLEILMAERVGFEPTEQLPTRFLSKEVLSATQPSLRFRGATVPGL